MQTLTRLMAPILAFTAEEIWQLAASGGTGDSVMLGTWHELPAQAGEAELSDRWLRIREVKAEASKVLEDLRTAGGIGSSLQAEVEIRASGAKYDLLADLEDDLRFVLICSKTTLVRATDPGAEAVIATPSAHVKCARCWHWRDDVGSRAEHPELCGRCGDNLFGAGEATCRWPSLALRGWRLSAAVIVARPAHQGLDCWRASGSARIWC